MLLIKRNKHYIATDGKTIKTNTLLSLKQIKQDKTTWENIPEKIKNWIKINRNKI